MPNTAPPPSKTAANEPSRIFLLICEGRTYGTHIEAYTNLVDANDKFLERITASRQHYGHGSGSWQDHLHYTIEDAESFQIQEKQILTSPS